MSEHIDPERAIYEIQALTVDVAAQIRDTLRALKDYRRGYPTGGDGSGDGSSRTEALALAPKDAVDRDQRDLEDSIERALRSMRTVYNIVGRYRAARVVRDPSQMWCRNHARYSMNEPVYRGERCRDCYDFWLVERVEMPHMLIEHKARGGRLTESLVVKALGPKAGWRGGSAVHRKRGVAS